MATEPGEVNFSGVPTLVADISSLYLNQEFSDVTFVINGEKLYAHKIILAVRSKVFKNLLYKDGHQSKQDEITIEDVSTKAFKLLLEFIYTGGITIQSTDENDLIEMLGMARKHSFKDLQSAIVEKMKTLLNLENVPLFLNTVYLHNLIEEFVWYLEFINEHSLEFLTNDNFTQLNHGPLVKLLKSDEFFVPSEVEVFKAVLKWRETNKDIDDLAIKEIRLSCLTVADIVSTVWPTKLYDNEVLLGAIAEIVGVRPKNTVCRMPLPESEYQNRGVIFCNMFSSLMYQNFATVKGAKVISGKNTKFLLNGNIDIQNCASHAIGDEEGITVELGTLSPVNHIHMRLYDKHKRHYSYYIEISTDKENWRKVIDYTKYHCRSDQDLYFSRENALYIRIVGTASTVDDTFRLISFEADCKSTSPKVFNGIIRPTENVATPKKKAIVIEGGNPEELLNGNTVSGQDWECTYHTIREDCIMVELAQPYLLSSMRLRLFHYACWDRCSYYIETSVDKTDWEMAADKQNGDHMGWQDLRFTERPVVYVKIVGTFHNFNKWFHVVHFESPSATTIQN